MNAPGNHSTKLTSRQLAAATESLGVMFSPEVLESLYTLEILTGPADMRTDSRKHLRDHRVCIGGHMWNGNPKTIADRLYAVARVVQQVTKEVAETNNPELDAALDDFISRLGEENAIRLEWRKQNIQK